MNTKLLEAYQAVQKLPAEAQEVIAEHIIEEVKQYFGESSLTAEQIAIVEKRFSQPFEYASDAEVERVFAKHNINVPLNAPTVS